MIYKDGNKQVVSIYEPKKGQQTRSILAIYKGARLVWETIRSCFGRGFWMNQRPWLNEDVWRNNR